MPPQSTKGMGGKETSKRASAASRVTLHGAPIPVSPPRRKATLGTNLRGLSYIGTYLYVLGFAAALAIFVCALSF